MFLNGQVTLLPHVQQGRSVEGGREGNSLSLTFTF